MKKQMYLLLLLLGVTSLVVAQEPNLSNISGVVMDSTNNATLPFPTISVVKQSNPQAYVLRTVANIDGRFQIELPQNDTYILVFESMGLVSTHRTVTTDKASIDLGEIRMKEAVTQLEEMMVSAQRPLVKSSIDRIAYDIASDPESATASTLQMLKKVPLLTVGQDDEIKVKGSTKFKVHINGKPSNLVANSPSMALKSIPASTVERIEVITEPGAKYDSEGLDGIINIVTKSALSGYMLNLNGGLSTRPGTSGGAYFTTKVGKFGLTANAQYYQGDQPFTSTSTLDYLQNPTTKTLASSSIGNSKYDYMYGSLNASYEFDSLRLLSLSVGGHGQTSNTYIDKQTYSIAHSGDTALSYLTDQNSDHLYSGITASLDYQRSFQKPDQNLTLSYLFSYTPYNTGSLTDIVGYNYPSYQQKFDTRANNNEHTFQIDYTEPFAQKHIMELGVKYIMRQNLSDNHSYLMDTTLNLWMPDTLRESSNIDQMQHIAGAYASYSLRLQNWNFRAGARLEYMMQDIATQDTSLLYNDINLIPNINISYTPTPSQRITLGYTQRLSRPGIYYLNPFLDNSNPYSVSQGNPNLDPERAHSLSLSYGYFSQKFNMNLSLSGGYVNNSIQSVSSILEGTDSVMYTTYQNIGTSLSAHSSLYMQWTICKWASWWMNANGSYRSYDGGTNLNLQNDGWGLQAYSGVNLSLPWKLKLAANGGGSTPTVTLQGHSTGWYYYSLSLSRSFLDGKLNIDLSANNFAEQYQRYENYAQTDYYTTRDISNVTGRSFSLNVSYRLGEMKEQVKTVKKGIKNDDMMQGSAGGSGNSAGGGQNQ